MRETSLEEIYKLAKKDNRVFFVGSDLGVGTLNKFKEEMPERFFMEGISEGYLIGMASGLALEGKIVYVNTISTFITRRCYEQLAVDVCLHNLNVRMIGNGGGMVYAPLGPTHMAIEDLSIMRAIPNMTIVVPADADEMRRLIPQTLGYPGPIYIRLAKGNDPIVTRDSIPFTIGKAVPMREGRDALLVTTGITLKNALEAADQLGAQGIDVAVLHVPTVKPLDVEQLLDRVSAVRAIVSVEENTVIGGLGSAVAEIIAEADFGPAKKFKRLGIPDVFPDRYGSQAALMDYYRISTREIIFSVTRLLDATSRSPTKSKIA
ncbi:MAG TPA: transketolase C-terminal domain-containing protein [Acidobacteriota bacterium]|nr:transketolase C-terminal domain-containing protein [Acidobacteriota bacterium]